MLDRSYREVVLLLGVVYFVGINVWYDPSVLRYENTPEAIATVVAGFFIGGFLALTSWSLKRRG